MECSVAATFSCSVRRTLIVVEDNKVVFCTGGGGTICSAQVRALVHLGANACIVGRNVEKTESMAKDIATARKDAKVLGIGSIDVRSVESLQAAVDKTVKELGGIDYVMSVLIVHPWPTEIPTLMRLAPWTDNEQQQCWSCRQLPRSDKSTKPECF